MTKVFKVEDAVKLTKANVGKKTAREEAEQTVLDFLIECFNKQIQTSASEGNDVLQVINPSAMGEIEAPEDADAEDKAVFALFDSPNLVLGIVVSFKKAGYFVDVEVDNPFSAPLAITIKWGEAAKEAEAECNELEEED